LARLHQAVAAERDEIDAGLAVVAELARVAADRRQLARLGRLEVPVPAQEPEVLRDRAVVREALLAEQTRLARAAADRRDLARPARIELVVQAGRRRYRALTAAALAGTLRVLRRVALFPRTDEAVAARRRADARIGGVRSAAMARAGAVGRPVTLLAELDR